VENKAVLFSIKPKYVSLISAGEKTYELRRKCPKVSAGDLALVYESSPTMCLVGAFVIGDIIQAKPASLWRKVGAQSGVSRQEFLEYFNGCETASAIEISQYWNLEQQVPLKQLRSQNKIEPPQSFRYLCQEKTGQLLSQGAGGIG
jgi:predicted transcriptional regulator|tara:strand:- start:564 stop:1001 length:438 start_codon:yes stop_codon:yes gene_type:complete